MTNIKLLQENTEQMLAASGNIRQFLKELLDEASFVETDVFLSGANALYGSVPFGEGVVTGYGSINGNPVYIAAQNPEVLKGSFGAAQAEKILKCIERATKNNVPFISVIDSAGIRVGEGLAALDGYAKIFAAINNLRYYTHHISVVRGTAAGLGAILAEMSDFVFISETGSLSLGAPMAVSASAGMDKKASEILGSKLHLKTGSAAFTFKNAEDIKNTLNSLLEYLDEELVDNADDPNRVSDILNTEVNAKNLLSALCDDGKYLEINKDYCPDVMTVLSSVNSLPVGIIVTNATGKASKLDKKAVKKMKKFVKLVTKYNITLINLVDTEGFAVSLDEEEKGIALSAAHLVAAVADADVTKLSVITGSAIGAAYTALCSKGLGYDYVVAFPNAKLAPMTADAAVNFMYKSEIDGSNRPGEVKEALKAKYAEEEANPFVSAKLGGVDNIIEPALLRPYIASALTMTVR